MNKLKPVHPFPARMAPEIALAECMKISEPSVILDPMCGSGTTLRMAIEHGHKAIGSDMDPMAVLIASVNTTSLDQQSVRTAIEDVSIKATDMATEDTYLPWIDNDEETEQFICFWFAQKQIEDLRKIITVINRDYEGALQSFLKVAVSKLIITKEQSASLARDTSHSRPHRVAVKNDYEVIPSFIRSANQLADRIPKDNVPSAEVHKADARNLTYIEDSSVDLVITSPPYLNAIDYMRGHKLSLVWMGHKINELRTIRSTSIGAERRPDVGTVEDVIAEMIADMAFYGDLQPKEKGMFNRYMLDMYDLMAEVRRVLKPGGRAVLVVGNSCLKGVFIKNTMAVINASKLLGLEFIDELERDLPANRRYLPPPSLKSQSFLTNRMRTESILSFKKSASSPA